MSSVVNEGKMSVIACLSHANLEKNIILEFALSVTACNIIATTDGFYREITRANSEIWRRRTRKERKRGSLFAKANAYFRKEEKASLNSS